MAEIPIPDLSAAQVATLEKLMRAGFKFVTLERVERYLAVEKSGFIALLEPVEGKIKVFGQVGYRMGEGIGMLTEQGGRKVFVWKKQSFEATPELLDNYARFKTELAELLGPGGL